jgi:hypothetical protein
MSTPSEKQFKADVEGGNLVIDSHYLLLRIAIIYAEHEYTVFHAAEKLHSYGWSFGKGSLRFNRYTTLRVGSHDTVANESI